MELKKIRLSIKDVIAIVIVGVAIGGAQYKLNSMEARVGSIEADLKTVNVPLINNKIDNIESNVQDIKDMLRILVKHRAND